MLSRPPPGPVVKGIIFTVQDQEELCKIRVRIANEEEEASAAKMKNAVNHAGEWKGQVTVLKRENTALKGELEVGSLPTSAPIMTRLAPCKILHLFCRQNGKQQSAES